MKKYDFLVLIVLIVVLLFAGCSSNDSNNKVSQEPNNTMHNIDLDTTVNESCDQTSIEYKIEYIPDCEAPGWFSNIDEFYTFATTQGRNPELYTEDYVVRNIDWYASVQPQALIKLEDIFDLTEVGNSFKGVKILSANNYIYEFYNNGSFGIIISETTKDSWLKQMGNKYSIATGSNSFETNQKVSFDTKYYKEFSDLQVFKDTDSGFYYFHTYVDGFSISIYTEKQVMDTRSAPFIANFFDDQKVESVIQILKNAKND